MTMQHTGGKQKMEDAGIISKRVAVLHQFFLFLKKKIRKKEIRLASWNALKWVWYVVGFKIFLLKIGKGEHCLKASFV